MTVDEIFGLFKAVRDGVIFGATDDELVIDVRERAERAGVTAIVRALRDEMGDPSTFKSAKPECCGRSVQSQEHGGDECCCQPDVWLLHEELMGRMNDILGDAGEKVGTHGSPELDEDARKLEAMGQDPGMTIEEFLDEHFKPPATDVVTIGTSLAFGVFSTPAHPAASPSSSRRPIMDEAIKELVKRLRGGRCPQCFGFGEVSYGGELVRCSCRDKYEAPISMEHRKAAADALEALAGEVEKAREYAADLRLRAKEAADARVYCAAKLTAAEAERDRLKAALGKKLSPKARKKLGDLSESMIAIGDGRELELILNWYDESRKALGDAS